MTRLQLTPVLFQDVCRLDQRLVPRLGSAWPPMGQPSLGQQWVNTLTRQRLSWAPALSQTMEAMEVKQPRSETDRMGRPSSLSRRPAPPAATTATGPRSWQRSRMDSSPSRRRRVREWGYQWPPWPPWPRSLAWGRCRASPPRAPPTACAATASPRCRRRCRNWITWDMMRYVAFNLCHFKWNSFVYTFYNVTDYTYNSSVFIINSLAVNHCTNIYCYAPHLFSFFESPLGPHKPLDFFVSSHLTSPQPSIGNNSCTFSRNLRKNLGENQRNCN